MELKRLDYTQFIETYTSRLEDKYTSLVETKQFNLHSVTKEEQILNKLLHHDEIISNREMDVIAISAILDLTVIAQHYLQSNLAWEKKYFLRTACLSIYEFGKRYKESFKKRLSTIASLYPEISKEMRELEAHISDFCDKHLKEIEDIRNSVIAHYDNNPMKFYIKVLDINQQHLSIANEYLKILIHFIQIIDDANNLIEKRACDDFSQHLGVPKISSKQ